MMIANDHVLDGNAKRADDTSSTQPVQARVCRKQRENLLIKPKMQNFEQI
jgi:hypothetical protein